MSRSSCNTRRSADRLTPKSAHNLRSVGSRPPTGQRPRFRPSSNSARTICAGSDVTTSLGALDVAVQRLVFIGYTTGRPVIGFFKAFLRVIPRKFEKKLGYILDLSRSININLNQFGVSPSMRRRSRRFTTPKGGDMPTIHLLSGGAAQGLVKALEPDFARAYGCD